MLEVEQFQLLCVNPEHSGRYQTFSVTHTEFIDYLKKNKHESKKEQKQRMRKKLFLFLENYTNEGMDFVCCLFVFQISPPKLHF